MSYLVSFDFLMSKIVYIQDIHRVKWAYEKYGISEEAIKNVANTEGREGLVRLVNEGRLKPIYGGKIDLI